MKDLPTTLIDDSLGEMLATFRPDKDNVKDKLTSQLMRTSLKIQESK